MSKKRASSFITPAAACSWVKLNQAAILSGFTQHTPSRNARLSYAPVIDRGVILWLSWGDIGLKGRISRETGWCLVWVPDIPEGMVPYTFKDALTHDENHLFDNRTWSLAIAWDTFTNAKPEHIGARIWQGIGSDVTDAWPAVERFCAHLRRIRSTREGVFSRLMQRGWQREGDVLHMPGLCAPSLRIDASGGAYVVEQVRALPADDLAAFLERYPQD